MNPAADVSRSENRIPVFVLMKSGVVMYGHSIYDVNSRRVFDSLHVSKSGLSFKSFKSRRILIFDISLTFLKTPSQVIGYLLQKQFFKESINNERTVASRRPM